VRAQQPGILSVNANNWNRLKDDWKIMTVKTQKWHEKLDRSLPGRLGLVGKLVIQTESLLAENIEICREEFEGTGGHKKTGDDLGPIQRRQQLEVVHIYYSLGSA